MALPADTEPRQQPLDLAPHESREEAAPDTGILYLLVKEHARDDSRAWGSHVKARDALAYAGPFATVHVMSRPAGGQVRGYVRINGILYLGRPAYPQEWDDLDLSRRLQCPVVRCERTHE